MGFVESFVESNDEKKPGLFARNMVFSKGGMYTQLSPEDNIYAAQTVTIRELADEGNCVIVGRCANHILKDRDDVVRIFIHAPLEDRVSRKMMLSKSEKSATAITKEILSVDRSREKYYNFYTGEKWGDCRSYHICIDTSKVGIDGAVEIIVNYIEQNSVKRILPD